MFTKINESNLSDNIVEEIMKHSARISEDAMASFTDTRKAFTSLNEEIKAKKAEIRAFIKVLKGRAITSKKGMVISIRFRDVCDLPKSKIILDEDNDKIVFVGWDPSKVEDSYIESLDFSNYKRDKSVKSKDAAATQQRIECLEGKLEMLEEQRIATTSSARGKTSEMTGVKMLLNNGEWAAAGATLANLANKMNKVESKVNADHRVSIRIRDLKATIDNEVKGFEATSWKIDEEGNIYRS